MKRENAGGAEISLHMAIDSDPASATPGALPIDSGVRYRVWAPAHESIEVRVYTEGGAVARTVPLLPAGDGCFEGIDAAGRAGDWYKFRLPNGGEFPDPASRAQAAGVHGPSRVVEARGFVWHDATWARPAFRDLIIYELHVGTFSPEGTFRSAIERLEYLHDIGINAIELMPVADFPGARGWGYDGVLQFAPAEAYGSPDDLRALVDAAHALGIAVLLDVVFNHFGPAGNYMSQYAPAFFSSEEKTPWGDAINFGHAHSAAVRAFYRANLLYWMEDFHLDGFRLDATHAIIDASEPHMLAELAALVQARGGYMIAEDDRNEARLITDRAQGGYGFDAVWADDFHHIVEVGLIEASVYRRDFEGDLAELEKALQQGWLYTGQFSKRRGKPKGTPAGNLPPERFVFCISNHDQIGNRALGERLNHLVSPAAYRAASALLLLTPHTPLLFMGQEWGASTPFQYFTDHDEELGRAIEQGRRAEFREAFASSRERGEVPPCQAESTFLRSKLNWPELDRREHAQILALYRELIRLRREQPARRPASRGLVRDVALAGKTLALRAPAQDGDWLVLCDLNGEGTASLSDEFCALEPPFRDWQRVLSTNGELFGGSGATPIEDPGTLRFTQPEVQVFRAR
jgi:maltooligosyltrehalose trehalohydrolase